MRIDKEYINLFLETSSIRGCNKILKAKNKYIRWIWVIYLIITTMGLIITIRFIVEEYLKYAVNLQTYIEMDSPEPFPDISICNHQPFSSDALNAWNKKEIISPTDFNLLLRRNSVNNNVSLADMFQMALIRDDVSDYYQNLAINETIQISHTREKFIFLCLLKWTKNWAISGAGCNDSSLSVTRFSHSRYFNCYTVKLKMKKTEFEELNLILSLGPMEDELKSQENSFLFNVFDQATGLRIVIHEPDSQPDIDRQGINIEPNRINEVIYKTEQIKHISTPINPCSNNVSHFNDLNISYLYDFDLCIKSHLQQRVLNECSCYYREYIRFNMPNETHPYCGNFLNGKKMLSLTNYSNRQTCVEKIQQMMAKTRKSLYESNLCPKRCSRTNYKIKSSATNWRFSDWQIGWVKRIADSFDAEDPSVVRTYAENRETNNLRVHDLMTKNSNYTFLVIKRESNDTEIRNEQLVLTISALFSRIGGLCSLYIGFSFAVAIELIEFVYNSYTHRNNMKQKEINEHVTMGQNSSADPKGPFVFENNLKRNNNNNNNEEVWYPLEKASTNYTSVT